MIVAAVVAMLASTGGFALAQALTSTTVQHGSSYYSVSDGAVAGYSQPPVLNWTTVKSGTCNAAPAPDVVPGTNVVALISEATNGSCGLGDFAAEFSFNFSATIITQTNTFTVFSQIGGGAYQSNSVQVTVGAGGPIATAFTATVHVYVDFGPSGLPPGGITALNILVQ